MSVPSPTARVSFRCWQREDSALAQALWGDPRVMRYLDVRGALDEAAVRARLDAEIETERAHGIQYWPIFLRDGGAHIGACGLRPRDGKSTDVELELGFQLRPPCWGRGLAVEAARAVIAHAFDRLGIGALFAGHHPENEASRAVLEKLGFTRTGEEHYAPTGLAHPSYLLRADEHLLIAVDVDYADDGVRTGCVAFHAWASASPSHEWVDRVSATPAPYRPGRFFERELPFIVSALSRLRVPPDAVIVDGHVDLGARGPGLGARVHEALPSHPPVIGVAKRPFTGAPSIPVLRGRSRTALHVTAVGIDPGAAAAHIAEMHGPHRIPSLLLRADHLARGLTRPGAR